jgi:hypothetical protein
LSRFAFGIAFGINNLENDLGISPKFSSPLGGRG